LTAKEIYTVCKRVPGVGKITVGSLAPMTREYSNEVIKTAVAPLFLAENAEKVGILLLCPTVII
jgi:hypothetical protein